MAEDSCRTKNVISGSRWDKLGRSFLNKGISFLLSIFDGVPKARHQNPPSDESQMVVVHSKDCHFLEENKGGIFCINIFDIFLVCLLRKTPTCGQTANKYMIQ